MIENGEIGKISRRPDVVVGDVILPPQVQSSVPKNEALLPIPKRLYDRQIATLITTTSRDANSFLSEISDQEDRLFGRFRLQTSTEYTSPDADIFEDYYDENEKVARTPNFFPIPEDTRQAPKLRFTIVER